MRHAYQILLKVLPLISLAVSAPATTWQSTKTLQQHAYKLKNIRQNNLK